MSVPSSCSAGVPITGVYSSSGPCSVPASIAKSPPPPPPLRSSEPRSLPPSLHQRSSQLIGGGIESQFRETRAALKDTKRKNREQARKARLLVTAVAAKIEEKDEEMERVWQQGYEKIATLLPIPNINRAAL